MREYMLRHLHTFGEAHAYLLEYHYKMNFELKRQTNCYDAQQVINKYTDYMMNKIASLVHNQKMNFISLNKMTQQNSDQVLQSLEQTAA